MAFQIVQTFTFENMEYSYDRTGDVLYISFGPPVPAIAIQIEDWLALRICLQPPVIVGMTVVGFKNIFEKINGYIEQELPERIERLTKVSMNISYDDETDILIMRFAEPLSLRERIKNLFGYTKPEVSVFEPVVAGVYVEKNLPSKDIVGVKILEFTKIGPSAIEAFFGTIVDTIFEPHTEGNENAHLITNALIQHLDRKKLAALAA